MGASCGVPELEDHLDDALLDDQKFDFVPEDNHIRDIKDIFVIGKTLGSGVSCSVYVGKMKSNNIKYAVKEMVRDDEFNPRSFRQEVDFLTSLGPHDNILKYETAYITPKYFYIVTELCTGGALFDRIRKLSQFSEKQAAALLTTLIKAIQHCHTKQIVHRDLKPENVVFDRIGDDANLVIIDYGDAARVDDHEMYSEFVGTIYYLPPEITRHRHGWELKKSDMWTIGVIAYVLVTGKPPFFGRDNKQILKKIMMGKFSWPSNIKLSSSCKNFIRSLLQLDCHKRLSPQQALRHPFLTGKASDEHLGNQYLQNIGDFYSGNVLKKMIINNMIVDMGREEKKILIRAFREIDLDRNGFIEKEEIIAYLKRTGKASDDAIRAATQMMNVMDPKNTGKISLQDFVRAKTVAKLQENETNMLKETYTSLSKGEDVLAADTFRNWMKENDQRLSEKQLDEIITTVDNDGNGYIDFDEFETALKSVEDVLTSS
eukprot:CAMPEP_0201573756 /NCGR_PEP_ID=MMETSP0190_2-20130828/17779_1 /ASSEMBLY_ACC=CAM_ASM_000263 /TAXON_ID=37353 /ORGANISM="Rosalina sp." /LENGTH=486 /DNA_ID=CAMNT_0048001089 /DNA_START=47 /DNA_END=1507 /DNA_ORIENTATION=+